MFTHVTVGSTDLDRSRVFYDAVLTPLGLTRRVGKPDGGPPFLCWHRPGVPLPRFFVSLPFDGRPASASNGGMVAFLAPSVAAVDTAYASGMANGGTDEGAPGERAHYAVGYYGAYLRDPDFNKLHVVFRGDIAE